VTAIEVCVRDDSRLTAHPDRCHRLLIGDAIVTTEQLRRTVIA
jgi:hypothetical protein